LRERVLFHRVFETDGGGAFLGDRSFWTCYISDMTKEQIRAIFDRVLTWPPERLDDVADILLHMETANGADKDEPWPLTDEERAELEEAEREIERGDAPASDEEVAALFRLGRR
jgi:hypothetical protein